MTVFCVFIVQLKSYGLIMILLHISQAPQQTVKLELIWLQQPL